MRSEGETSPWRNPRFRVFAVGNAVNNIGEAVYDVTLPLLAYELTGSLAVMGVLAAMTPASLLLGPVLGGIADRWGPRVLVVPGLLVQLVVAFAMNVVALSPRAPLWLFIALAALLQLAGAAYRVGWMTGVPHMFPEAPVRSRGSLSSLYVATTVIGPLIASSTMGVIGYRGLLWINLVTFVAPLVVWLLGVHPPPLRCGGERVEERGFGLGEGVKAIRSSPPLIASLLVLLPLDFVTTAAMPTLVTYHLRDTIDLAPPQVAVVFGAMNAAGVMGALAVSERRRFRPGAALAFTTLGLTLGLLLASVGLFWVMVAALIGFRFFESAGDATSAMLTVHYVPADVFGRASGLLRLAHGIPCTLGPVLVAPVVSVLGTSGTFAVLGVVGLLPLLLLVRFRRVWAGAAAPVSTPVE